MTQTDAEIVCCGHICLDVIPRMTGSDLPPPGGLAEVGPADLATGGSVSNTGLALHKMGIKTRLVGAVGDDMFGQAVRQRFEAHGPGLSAGVQVVTDQPTSYTVVVSPPGSDRRFLHCPGVNATLTDADIGDNALAGAKHMHFGYPPAMKAICTDQGKPLRRLFERAQNAGLTTSLDMCGVDPHGWAGRVDWPALLRNVLPHVDVFLPSLDELAAMTTPDPAALLALGCDVLVIKDGENGLRIHTSQDAERFGPKWGNRVLKATTFDVEVVGTTGAGDTTIAGFLAGLVRGATLEDAADLACAAGAQCVQSADATSGIDTLDTLRAFIANKPHRRTP